MERRKKGSYKAKKVTQTLRTISREIPLTKIDRITYVYVKDTTTDVIQEVINVSYEAWIEKGWLTILRYDSTRMGICINTSVFLSHRRKNLSVKSIFYKRVVTKTGSPGQSRILKRIFRPTDGH